ncbi:MAG: ribonuclease activity regulator RraA [Candidatus Latescibacteria bacterium]|nr:ribonuclease activity regulator RraA [Candidatus Latescibacterota bacterium]
MSEEITVTQETLDKLMVPSTATLTSALNKRGLWNIFMNNVSPLKPGMKMAGPAFTMRYIPSREDVDRIPVDNLVDIQRVGIEQVGPGEVFVIDARGDDRAGTMGSILATRLHVRGAAGIVCDGSYRDSPAIADIGIPAFSSAMNAHTNKTIHSPIDLQLPIACGGVAVYPGDIIVGDCEGVVVIPRHLAAEVAEEAAASEQKENFILEKIQNGASIVGTYPPDENTLVEFEAWKKERNE